MRIEHFMESESFVFHLDAVCSATSWNSITPIFVVSSIRSYRMLFTDETKNECSNGKQKVTIKINQNTIFLFITQFSLISRESTHSTHTTYASGFVCSCVWKIGKKRTQISLNLVKSRLAEEMKIVSGIERALQKQLHMDSKIVYVIFTIFDFFSHFKMNDKKKHTHTMLLSDAHIVSASKRKFFLRSHPHVN